jgi:hypothetical protein
VAFVKSGLGFPIALRRPAEALAEHRVSISASQDGRIGESFDREPWTGRRPDQADEKARDISQRFRSSRAGNRGGQPQTSVGHQGLVVHDPAIFVSLKVP